MTFPPLAELHGPGAAVNQSTATAKGKDREEPRCVMHNSKYWRLLKQVSHSGAVARERCQVLRRSSAVDASVVPTDISGMRGHMGNAGILPECDFLPPVILVARARRDPDLQSHVLRFAAGVTDQLA